MIPDIKLDSISLKANPKAKPVRPSPATIADTLIPIVPRAVMNPIITIKFFIILDITFNTFVEGELGKRDAYTRLVLGRGR